MREDGRRKLLPSEQLREQHQAARMIADLEVQQLRADLAELLTEPAAG